VRKAPKESPVIDYTLSSLSERLDTNFLTSCWLPAFFAVLANVGLFTGLVGWDALEAWLYNLDAFEETIVAVIILVVITMVALLLRALSFMTMGFFVGDALPRIVAEWATRGQQRTWARAQSQLSDGAHAVPPPPVRDQVRRLIDQRFPRDEAALRPTRLGNMLATAAEYPWIVYEMDGLFWGPHLWPSLPNYVSDPLDAAQSRLLGLLNLSLVCGGLAVEAVLVLGLAGHHWVAAAVSAVIGAVLAWLCYRAAVNQSLEVATHIRAAFTLYRHEILKQLGLDIPDTIATERALWQSLTEELIGQPPSATPTGGRREMAAATDGRTEAAGRANG
jgi:hypothetical protein